MVNKLSYTTAHRIKVNDTPDSARAKPLCVIIVHREAGHQQLKPGATSPFELMLHFFTVLNQSGAHNSERHSGKINTLHRGERCLM